MQRDTVLFGSKNGKKGVLVSGYGISAEGKSAEMAKKLTVNRTDQIS